VNATGAFLLVFCWFFSVCEAQRSGRHGANL
jgi:hypothetical protein